MTSPDRGYTILLSHLQDATSKLPPSTIEGALAHHLAKASPLPTPLAATAISSPFYLSQPFTYAKLQSFSTAFRHATHLKYRSLIENAQMRSKISQVLGRTMQAAMGQWVINVSKGFHGGNPVLRLAGLSGLLLGAEDVRIGDRKEEREGIDVGSVKSGLEDETIVALAEVMDAYAYGINSSPVFSGVEEWEREFQPAGQDTLSLALVFASQSLPLIAQNKLKVLPLAPLARLLISTISSAFKAGTFLSSVSASVTLSPDHQVHISASSPLAQTLQSMSSSPLTVSIASISRLTANILALLIDTSSSHLYEGLHTISICFDMLQEMAKKVEFDWISSPLANVTDLDIASDSKELTKSVWTNLKTLLFSNIMLAEAVLSASVFIPPQPTDKTPTSLATQALHILSHLSFVISEFGGVATTTRGFEHLRKAFYLALDILAHEHGEDGDADSKAESFVRELCFSLSSQRAESAATPPRRAKQAFALATIEQLVPVLSDRCIRDSVWGVSYPYLSDPSHRQTYESAHSVILAILASHAQRQQNYRPGNRSSNVSQNSSRTSRTIAKRSGGHVSVPNQNFAKRILAGVMKSENDEKIVGPEAESSSRVITTADQSGLPATFVRRMIPFYASCLIDNSKDGMLNTPQLCLAYSALVRSATMSTHTPSGPTDDALTLAWYSVQLLLDTIHELSSADQGSKGEGKYNERSTERSHRLHLMLISTVSSLPLTLMLRALDETRRLIVAYPEDDSPERVGGRGKKAELVEALFSELLEKTGDREKEAAMIWWYQYRSILVPESREEKRKRGSLSNKEKQTRNGVGEERRTIPKYASGGEGSPTLSRL